MSEPGYHDALRLLCQDAGADLHRVLAVACEPVPARDPVVYLADFAWQVLVPLATGAAEQEMTGTMAGRAVVELTTRTGVLAVTVPHADRGRGTVRAGQAGRPLPGRWRLGAGGGGGRSECLPPTV